MSDEDSKLLEGETRLEKILADYLHSVAVGTPLDRDAIIAAHPELAGELQSFFRNREAIERVAAPIVSPSPFDTTTVGLDASDDTNGTWVKYVGDYELLSEIARGGMGVVYKARQVSLNRLVAVKMILSARMATPDDVARFHVEAEAAANLDQPHITPIFEIGEHQGQHYFSMKLIEGCNLRDVMQDLRDDIHSGVRLLVKVARAVQHAHERGVLHRDLKPSNILLDAAGEPFVTDFGLAKRFGENRDLTSTGAVIGTPSYMSPEQAAGDASRLGPGVDVYGIGAILYELFTGRPPFRGDSVAATLLLVATEPPVPPRFVNASVSRDLEAICLKCLEKDAALRYATASELAEDLDRFLDGVRVSARRRIGVLTISRSAKFVVALVGFISGVGVLLATSDANSLQMFLAGLFGSLVALVGSVAAVCVWNEFILPAWLLTRASNPLAKLAFGLGLVLMSLSIFCVAQFIRAFGPPESGAANESGLLIAASVLAAIIGKVLCLASATPDVVQRPLICSITADLVAFGAVIASSTRSSTENSEGIVLSFGQAEPLFFYVGATLFVLTVKRIAAEFDESAVEAKSRRLLIWMIAVFPALVAATWVCQTWFQDFVPIMAAYLAILLVFCIVRFAQLTRGLQEQILLRT